MRLAVKPSDFCTDAYTRIRRIRLRRSEDIPQENFRKFDALRWLLRCLKTSVRSLRFSQNIGPAIAGSAHR